MSRTNLCAVHRKFFSSFGPYTKKKSCLLADIMSGTSSIACGRTLIYCANPDPAVELKAVWHLLGENEGRSGSASRICHSSLKSPRSSIGNQWRHLDVEVVTVLEFVFKRGTIVAGRFWTLWTYLLTSGDKSVSKE